jgi:heme A synthase
MPTLPTFATRSKRPSRVIPNRRPIPWSAHILTLAVLALVYAAGYSGGRDASLSRAAAPLSRAATQPSPAANHPACHPNLKP